jgi:cysteine-rich repeat protein
LAAKPSIACTEVCGDGIVDFVEDCDDGNAVQGDGCDTNCTVSACGNGIQSAGELCDDGNVAGGDGCRSDCTVEACSDGIVDPGEECDDGNLAPGDCCDSACQDENGMVCTDLDNCTTGDVCVGAVCTGTLSPWISSTTTTTSRSAVYRHRRVRGDRGPHGTDIGSYQVIAVEDNHTCQYTVFRESNRQANFSP